MTDKPKPDNRLLPSERLLQIRQLVNAKGVVRVSELAARFDVSDMTIRRDLSELEKLGAIEKTFGAAVSSEQASFESSVSERMHLRQAHKRAIAKAAAAFVEPGDTVAIDASTTGLALAQELRMHNVHVVTSGLDVAQALRGGAATVTSSARSSADPPGAACVVSEVISRAYICVTESRKDQSDARHTSGRRGALGWSRPSRLAPT